MPGFPLHRLLRRCATLLLLIATPALAASPERWVLRANGTALMLFEITDTPQGRAASWSQPTRYETDGRSFTRVIGPAVRRSARAVHVTPDAIELVFDNPLSGGAPDRFVIRHGPDASMARMIWHAYAATPFRLTRVAATPALGPWRPDATCVADIDSTSDAEMTAIYDADQAARQDAATIDWAIVRAADQTRRARTQVLLTTDRLASADDLYHAAFVFQHGDTPDDYLKAHALAVIAVERGRAEATWIAAATLDRFLQSIDRPQVYGTQFHRPGTVFTQEPYDRTLLPDAVRQASRVPPLAAQEDQRSDWDRRLPLSRPAPH